MMIYVLCARVCRLLGLHEVRGVTTSVQKGLNATTDGSNRNGIRMFQLSPVFTAIRGNQENTATRINEPYFNAGHRANLPSKQS